jgi:hypothetical protein
MKLQKKVLLPTLLLALSTSLLAAKTTVADASSGPKAEPAIAQENKPSTPVAKNRPTDNPAKEKAIPNIEKNDTPAVDKAVPVIIDLPWKDIENPSDKG